MHKKTLGLLAFGLSATLLAGCGESSNPNEITFWNPFTGPDGENMQAMIDEYNETDPEYPINNVSMAEGDMYSRIPTVVNSGSGIPDLNIVHAERVVQFRDADMLVSFDEYLGEYPGITEENYVPEAWNIGELDGERYGLPLDIHTFGMYYNPELVEQYGPEILEDDVITIEEIRAVSERAVEDGISGIGVTWMKPSFMAVLGQHGGNLSEDGQNPTLDTQEVQDAFQVFVDLYNDGLTNEEGSEPLQMFLSGELVFLPEGIWMQNTMIDAEMEYGLIHFPQISEDPSNTVNWASSHQFVMFNNDDRDEEKTQGIIDFIDWLRDNSIEWARAGQIPATLQLLEDGEYQDMPQSFFVETEERQDTLRIFEYKYNGYVSEWLDANALDVVFGRITPEEAAQSMQREVNDMISQDSTGLEGEMEESEETDE
jgi:multiple sugar transport system substrate-binding protein